MNIKRRLFGPTVVDLAQEWRESTAHGDIARYHLISDIDRYVTPFFRAKYIRRITLEDAENYVLFLRDLKNVRTGAALSDATVKSALKNTRALFNYAVKNGIIKESPFKKISVKISEKEVRYYTKIQARKLLIAAYPDDTYMLAVLLGLCAGLRRGEVVALQWSDVDIKKRILHVRHSMNRIQGKNYVKLPKSGKKRSVPINDILRKALLVARKTSQSDIVIPISPGKLTLWFPEYAESIGLPRLTFHDLRRTFGTLLLQSGTDVKTVAALLGHSSYQITLKYYAGVNAEQIDAVNKMYR